MNDKVTLACLPKLHQDYARYYTLFHKLPAKRLHHRFFKPRLKAMHTALLEYSSPQGEPSERLVAFPGKKIYVNFNDPRSLLVLNEAYGDNSETAILKQILRPGDSFLDIGANHGVYGLVAAGIIGEKGRVISFEPQPNLAALIRKSAAANHFSHLTVKQVALSDQAGTAEFFVPNDTSGMAGLHLEFSGKDPHQTYTVSLERGDTVLEHENLPGQLVIKIDVEGHEIPALKGIAHLIRERRPYILFELNDLSLSAIGSSPEALVNTLVELGYSECSAMEEFPQRRPLSQATVPPKDMRNYLAFPPVPGTR